MSKSIIAPGMRIELRNEEWLVRRVDTTQSGGQQLTCVGLSELVRDKEGVFLTELDNNKNFILSQIYFFLSQIYLFLSLIFFTSRDYYYPCRDYFFTNRDIFCIHHGVLGLFLGLGLGLGSGFLDIS